MPAQDKTLETDRERTMERERAAPQARTSFWRQALTPTLPSEMSSASMGRALSPGLHASENAPHAPLH